jgi:hypothetical protein
LDARILALEQSLVATKLERQDLQTRLDAYKYPILTLPIEITSEIFVHFLPPYPERPPATELSSPHILGQICRTWREIAFGTPRLWRALELRDGSSTMALELLGTWLSRAKNCPLSICLEYNKYYPDMVIEVIPFVEAIIAHAKRWEYIDLKVPLNLQILELIASGSDFPLLCSVTVTHSGAEDMVDVPMSLFSNAPKLKEFTLCGY